MYEEIFPSRLAELRNQKAVSARDMSLSIGQNPGYINNIETGKALPSMASFFSYATSSESLLKNSLILIKKILRRFEP